MDNLKSYRVLPSSFRDPAGFVFEENGEIFRTVSLEYKNEFECFISSGLLDKLIKDNLIIPFSIINNKSNGEIYCVLKPERINQISYPYEWCFSQLKDAALLTIKIAKIALDYGMELKDASAYNIQFYQGKPIFIDLLSFKTKKNNSPWIAYRQFCQHFLSPLLLMAYKEKSLISLLKNHIDGIPLSITSNLLGLKKFNSQAFFHIYLQNKLSKKDINNAKGNKNFTKKDFFRILDNLFDIINNLKINIENDNWSNYYEHKILSDQYLKSKIKLVKDFISKIKPEYIYDIGSNTGIFSRISSQFCKEVISLDSDIDCIELLFQDIKKNSITNILPLVVDFANPSPSIGWENIERTSFLNRMKKDTILALAVIHHLIIGNNLPLTHLAEFFKKYCNNLIIEFIPLNDIKVQHLLKTRENIFKNITKEYFEKIFSQFFTIIERETIDSSSRILYLMKNNDQNR